MNTRQITHIRPAERGQSLVEMSLMLVILLTILSGVIDLGRGFFSYIAIQNAAGEGALYAAINPRCPHAVALCRITEQRLVEIAPGHWAACSVHAPQPE